MESQLAFMVFISILLEMISMVLMDFVLISIQLEPSMEVGIILMAIEVTLAISISIERGNVQKPSLLITSGISMSSVEV
jgi:hypothetical protein